MSSKNKRKPLVGGNWKCNGTCESIIKLLGAWKNDKKVGNHADVVISPPALYIPLVKSIMRKDYHVSAQNCYPEGGAFTGELSVNMLNDFDINYCIIGHSERRKYFKESGEFLQKKVVSLQKSEIIVIGCIGETKEERKAGKTFEVLFKQFKNYITAVKNWDLFVLAYEPVWAIGTGDVATPKQAQEVHEKLREYVAKEVSKEVAEKLRIIYGGSVKPKNCNDLFKEKDVDGFLVGGASLKNDFGTIINSTKEK